MGQFIAGVIIGTIILGIVALGISINEYNENLRVKCRQSGGVPVSVRGDVVCFASGTVIEIK